MKKLILSLALTLFAPLAFADTYSYDVTRMTCNSCVKAIKAQVCKLENVETCDVTIGKVVLKSKTGSKLDFAKIQEAVTRAGEYQISNAAPKN